jgi:hypothetical protein
MNRIAIDRFDLSLGGMDAPVAQAVRAELPGALKRSLARRLANAGTAGRTLELAVADLGTLELPAQAPPRVAAEAIAARLTDWLDVQLAADRAVPGA